MANSIIIQFSEDEFRSLLKDCISESIASMPSASSEPIKKHFNIKEASVYLDLAPQTLYGFTSNRTIPFIKKGKKLYFKKSDLDEWLSEGRKKTKDEIGAAITKNLADNGGYLDFHNSKRKIKS